MAISIDSRPRNGIRRGVLKIDNQSVYPTAMKIEDLDYDLPEELIATTPAEPRDSARLMVIDRATGSITHARVADLPTLPNVLRAGDVMVFNQTRVLQAWFEAVRDKSGGRVTGLYLESTPNGEWRVMLESRGTLLVGESLSLVPATKGSFGGGDAWLELLARESGGQWLAKLHADEPTVQLLERIGATPVPPYIRKQRKHQQLPEITAGDRSRYNTVYAHDPGSVAAPTAGLHFTPGLLERIDSTGVIRAMLTLHVGIGTFAPIRTDTVEAHDIHREWFEISGQTLAVLGASKARSGRVMVVGTTSVRALESLPADWQSRVSEGYSTTTKLLITPGFEFRFTDALLTNFHLPRSTLLAMVGSLRGVGIDRLKAWYRIAIQEKYRFYSYGDAMLIL